MEIMMAYNIVDIDACCALAFGAIWLLFNLGFFAYVHLVVLQRVQKKYRLAKKSADHEESSHVTSRRRTHRYLLEVVPKRVHAVLASLLEAPAPFGWYPCPEKIAR